MNIVELESVRKPRAETPEEQRRAALAAEEMHLRALKANHSDKIATIRARLAAGMSRRRLIETFGQDLVDMAIAGA